MAAPYKVIYGVRPTNKLDQNGKNSSYWTEIGVAFQNKDGSVNLVFNYFPVNTSQCTIQIRDPKPKEERPPWEEEPEPGSNG